MVVNLIIIDTYPTTKVFKMIQDKALFKSELFNQLYSSGYKSNEDLQKKVLEMIKLCNRLQSELVVLMDEIKSKNN